MEKARLIYLQNRIAYARDQIAYKELYIHFHPSIYKLAFLISSQTAIAEDVVSDVMAYLWSMEHKLAYIEHLKTYLLTATRNTAITYLRKSHKEIPSDDLSTETPLSISEIPDQQLISMELCQIMAIAVQNLPPKCQIVYRLIKEEGLTHKEVSDILQLSPNTLENHMRSALKKLRTILDAYLLKNK